MISFAVFLGTFDVSHAQDAAAEALFTEGEKLMDAGKLAEACDAFAASNKIEARAGTLIQLGQCRERNGQLASAWSAYKDALTRVKDPTKRAFAVARAKTLETRLSYLTISIPEDARVAGFAIARNGSPLERVLWNRAVPVDGGVYEITATASGTESWTTNVTVPVEHGKVTIDVPRLKELARPDPAATNQPITTKEAVHPAEPVLGHTKRPVRFTTKRKISIGVAAFGVASLATAIALGTRATGKERDAFDLCPDPEVTCANANRAHELTVSGHSLAVAANVMFGVAGAAAIGAAVLWFTGAPEASRYVAVVPAVDSLLVLATGRF